MVGKVLERKVRKVLRGRDKYVLLNTDNGLILINTQSKAVEPLSTPQSMDSDGIFEAVVEDGFYHHKDTNVTEFKKGNNLASVFFNMQELSLDEE